MATQSEIAELAEALMRSEAARGLNEAKTFNPDRATRVKAGKTLIKMMIEESLNHRLKKGKQGKQ